MAALCLQVSKQGLLVRIMRNNDTKVSITHNGLYPCGEGAGYAGGIMSASLDGYHVARAVMAKFTPFF